MTRQPPANSRPLAASWRPTAVSMGLHGGVLALLIIGIAKAPPPPPLPPATAPLMVQFFTPPPPPPHVQPVAPPPDIPPPVIDSIRADAPVLHRPPPPRHRPPQDRRKPPPPRPLPIPPSPLTPPVDSPVNDVQQAPITDAASTSSGPASASHAGPPSTMRGSDAGQPADYRTLVAAHLARFKRYPATARMRHMEGRVRLHLSIGRDGQILGCKVIDGSGYTVLDDGAMTMAERASPLPPPPDDMAGSRIDLVVPVDFFLRG